MDSTERKTIHSVKLKIFDILAKSPNKVIELLQPLDKEKKGESGRRTSRS